MDGWIRSGLAAGSNGRLVLGPEGWLLLDRLAVDLLEATAADPSPA